MNTGKGASNEGNHGYKFFNSSGPLQGYKRCLHEGGHRTAFVVRWTGQIEAGHRSSRQFAFYDFFATALELAELDPAVSLPPTQRDGTSLVPTLLGKSQPQKEFVYHEYCQPCEQKSGWGQALRMGNWSGVCHGHQPKTGWPVCNASTFKLYDLGESRRVL